MRAVIVGLAMLASGVAMAAPPFLCDMGKPSPVALCTEEYSATPTMLRMCIDDEAKALNFVNEVDGKIPDDILTECGMAGCKARHSRMKVTAACIRSLLSIKPRT